MNRRILQVNVRLGSVRRERYQGEDYLVAPFISLGPRVLNGSKGALYYPREEIEANPGVWNNIPLTLGHPTDPITNYPVSARDPEVLNRVQLGHVFKDRIDNGWRKGEAWFNIKRTQQLAPEVYASLNSNTPIELSTGLYTDNEESMGMTDNGQPYDYIARNYKPDHLAVLPNQKGACSIADGCGIMLNSKGMVVNSFTINPFVSEEQRKACYAKDDPNWDCDEWNDKTKGKLPKKAPTGNNMNRSFWQRLGEAFGIVFNGTTPLDYGGAQEPQSRHLESGEFLPKGARLGKKQFQTAAERGFGHRQGTEQAPADDYDDDGDENEDGPGEFKEQGDRSAHGTEMDHVPLQTDRGPKKPTENEWSEAAREAARAARAASAKANKTNARSDHRAAADAHETASEEFLKSGDSNRAKIHQDRANDHGLKSFLTKNIGSSCGGAESSNIKITKNLERCPECGGPMHDGECERCGYKEELEDNAGMPPPPMESDMSGGTGMAGSPMHIGPTTGGGTQNMKTRFYITRRSPLVNMSHSDIHGHLVKALNAKTGQDKPPPMIHEVHDDHVIYHDGDQHQKQAYEPDGDDGVKLTGKPTPVKPVTRFEPVGNQESSPMTAKQREQAVGWLTVNCDCWKEKKAVLMNREAFSDDDIKKLVANVIQGKKNSIMVANARKAGITLNEKAATSSADQLIESEEESNESDNLHAEDELPMFKDHKVKGKATINQQLALLAPEFREVVEQAIAANSGRKNLLISALTSNIRNPAEKAQAVKTLGGLKLPELEILARNLPPMVQPSLNMGRMGVRQIPQPRPRQAVMGPELEEVLNSIDEEVTENAGPDVLPMPGETFANDMRKLAVQNVAGGSNHINQRA